MSQLVGTDARQITAPSFDPEIAGLSADSREVRSGFLFAALPGVRTDGRRFMDDAVSRGAVAILASAPAAAAGAPLPSNVAYLEADNPRLALARIAARFCGRQPRLIAAVTGTNGKTSVAWFTRQLWEELGLRAASLGTLGVIGSGIERPGALTTPDPVALHRILAELARLGFEHVAMEASSHGLDQYRLDGVRIGAAAFTNLSRDHLDYHRTEAEYFAAKARLFEALVAPGGAAILNAEAAESETLAAIARRRGLSILDYGSTASALTLRAATPTPSGQRIELSVLGQTVTLDLSVVARFQAMNALAALGLVLAGGADRDAACGALSRLGGVPGRLQLAATRHNGAAIYVDYAHTPDALETVLRALRPHAERRLSVVFGCGGDRDAGKRPLMGEIAARLADRVFVTDDNPRGENPRSIRRQVIAASPGAVEIDSRREAIAAAIAELRRGDVLVVAGKGHERGQIVGTVVHPFDDVDAVRSAVAAIDGTTP